MRGVTFLLVARSVGRVISENAQRPRVDPDKRRLKQRVEVVFDWAKGMNYRGGDNPCDGLTKVLPAHRDEQQHHPALAYQAVPAFVAELRTTYATHSVRLALELLILTATRTNEVQRATWPELDLDAKVWTVPGARMKSGREHRIPLSARMVEIFEEARTRAGDSKWIFPGSKPEQPLSNMTFLKALRRLRKGAITTRVPELLPRLGGREDEFPAGRLRSRARALPARQDGSRVQPDGPV